MKVKIIANSGFVSFRLISEKWVKYLNMFEDTTVTMFQIYEEINYPSDITILHEANVVLDVYKPDKQKDGKIVCVEVSDTDRASEKLVNRLNENCDYVVTHSNFSAFGLRRGGVSAPIYVIPHGCDLPYIKEHPKTIGFYISLAKDQWVRKGSYISVEVANKLSDYPKLIKLYPDSVNLNIKNTKILGKIDDMTQFYSQIGIFALFPLGGAFELTVLEALCTGNIAVVTEHPLFAELPVITVKSKYVPKIMFPLELAPYHEGGGYEADIEDAVNKIKYAVENYDKIKKELDKHIPLLRKMYSWENIANLLHNFLENVYTDG